MVSRSPEATGLASALSQSRERESKEGSNDPWQNGPNCRIFSRSVVRCPFCRFLLFQSERPTGGCSVFASFHGGHRNAANLPFYHRFIANACMHAFTSPIAYTGVTV